MNIRSYPLFLSSALFLAVGTVSHAAVLVGELVNGSPYRENTVFDLSEYGTSDWAYWNTTASSLASGSPTNEMNGGSMIGDISVIGSGSLRGSKASTKPAASYSFTNGTSPVSGTVQQPSGLFSKSLTSDGSGVSLAIILVEVRTYEIYLWTGAYNVSVGTLSAKFKGKENPTFVNSEITAGTGTKAIFLYRLTVTPDQAGDELIVDVVNTDSGGGNAHILLSGAAVSAVPEPSSAGLWILGFTLAYFVSARRRRGPRA
ncbi:PEP-CTERM sorting domain-containing protein [Puniceicoccus vermicola]|uniref:Ice-binding protein C-terminal domain-containing protein n=1 Tax=Puniceicoccus vermicola TaxID=388746 RepID=A0A7X1B0G4_9BACT|nr:PEP-CTERM sorting domain-containing protein [Puniceicoccus vermicola]MBC2602205.1 hypothetical protein [Puniceicoccus vermicola]